MIADETMIGNRYQVVRKIGSGGMQDVYLALDVMLERHIALKTPQPGQAAKRFQNSARIAARVNHHNVAKTLDYFEVDGVIFLAEELVEGEDLEAKLSTYSAIDPHLGAHILRHLCRGLAASHHAGVIHRDLKPSNVLVSSGANIDFLKITDFGIATLTEEVFEDAARSGDLTRSTSGTVRGALPYMASEMMFRKPGERPGSPADIWSLGAMMFKVLTGLYPFGVYLEAAVNVKNKNREAWPQFMTANRQFAPLASDLQKLVDDCLSYNPGDRPTAGQLVARCQNLCYQNSERHEGVVVNLIQQGYSGFIQDSAGSTFFSMESVYGPVRPNPSTASKVCYSRFPGTPHPRAHPVVVLK